MIYYSFIYGVSDTDDPQLDPPTTDWGPNSTLNAICFKHAPLKSAGGHWPVRVATPWLLGYVLIIYEATSSRVWREVVNSAVRCEAICIIMGGSIRANPIILQKFGWYIIWLARLVFKKGNVLTLWCCCSYLPALPPSGCIACWCAWLFRIIFKSGLPL